MQIAKTKQKEWEERIESLKQQIQYWIDNPTEKTIEIIELFYYVVKCFASICNLNNPFVKCPKSHDSQ
jgi:hypothetical protein